MGEFAKPFPPSSRLDSIYTAPSRTLRVLVADDHEMIRLGLCALLQSQQIEICAQATNGGEAVEKSRQLSPDLIILDISMPVLGGIEAARQIRVFLPDVPILFFSTHNASSRRISWPQRCSMLWMLCATRKPSSASSIAPMHDSVPVQNAGCRVDTTFPSRTLNGRPALHAHSVCDGRTLAIGQIPSLGAG